jgi:hypothetical protein
VVRSNPARILGKKLFLTFISSNTQYQCIKIIRNSVIKYKNVEKNISVTSVGGQGSGLQDRHQPGQSLPPWRPSPDRQHRVGQQLREDLPGNHAEGSILWFRTFFNTKFTLFLKFKIEPFMAKLGNFLGGQNVYF